MFVRRNPCASPCFLWFAGREGSVDLSSFRKAFCAIWIAFGWTCSKGSKKSPAVWAAAASMSVRVRDLYIGSYCKENVRKN